MKNIDPKSLLIGVLATALVIACTDSTKQSSLIPEAKSATTKEEESKKKLPKKAKEPSEVIRIWNDALKDGDIELARNNTSKTSFEYIRKGFGSFEALSQHFQEGEKILGFLINNQVKQAAVARLTYTCFYSDYSIKQWEDTFFFEDGTWKVAPQFVRTTAK